VAAAIVQAMSGSRSGSVFLVERYWPGVILADVSRAAARTDAAARVDDQRLLVRYLGSALIPDEETVLSLFDGPSAAGVEEANRRGEFRFDRVRIVRTHVITRRHR